MIRAPPRPQVLALDCAERDYTVIITNSKDRPKLLFDTVCTLTDMKYVVFHGTVSTSIEEAYQEYYIRHINGHPLSSEAERQCVIRCLEAAIEQRTSEMFFGVQKMVSNNFQKANKVASPK